MGAKLSTRSTAQQYSGALPCVLPLTLGSRGTRLAELRRNPSRKEPHMAAVTYELVRECLNNVEDVAGRWQIEGGRVVQGKGQRHVANYSSVKRVSCGTEEQNTAQLWLTLFFLKGRPPENMTLHGAHDFNSGGEIGSVSAASPAHAARIGHTFKRVVNTLTIS